MKRFEVLIWIVALAFLAVGARNFELGMPVDGPLYAAIARNIAQSTDLAGWVHLTAPVPDFSPHFVEHPHLGFWTQAVFFKIFGAFDWVCRMPGHIYYVLFLALMFRWISRLHNERAATLSVLFLVTMPRFSNYMSAGYLDPGALFWGALAVERAQLKRDLQSGFCVGLCFLQKGLAVLGFGPILLFLLFASGTRQFARRVSLFVIAFVLMLATYQALLTYAGAGDFLWQYWQRQVTQRFSVQARAIRLFEFEYWIEAITASNGLFFVFLAGLAKLKKHSFQVPYLLFWSFVFLFAPNHRVGFQYNLMLLPWIAWVAAVLISQRFESMNALKWRKASTLVALFLVALIQYLPFRTHGNKEPGELRVLTELKAKGFINYLFVIDNKPADFITSSPLAWYANIQITGYPIASNLPDADATDKTAMISKIDPTPDLKSKGWCEYARDLPATIFVHCD